MARREDSQDRTSGSGALKMRGDPKVVGSNPTGPARLPGHFVPLFGFSDLLVH